MARLFFASWPDAATAARLAAVGARLAREAGGRPIDARRIHLTLAFLGEVPAERLAAARSALDRVRVPAFRLRLDRTGAFRGPMVAWAGPSRMPRELEAAQSALEAALRDSGFDLERRPFAAHVTLARRIERMPPALDLEPIEWRVDHVRLVESRAGAEGYVEVARRALDEG